MRTSNPALSDKSFRGLAVTGDRMTLAGTVHKCFLLIGILLAAAIFTWTPAPSGAQVWYFPALIGTLVLALIIIFKPRTAPFLAPVYAALEGALLGTVSSLFEFRYPGIALQAVLCTAGTFLALLFLYQSKLIRATENFKLGVIAATGGIALVYLIDMALRFFGMNVPYIHDGGPIGIAVSLAIVAIAALNLVLDFDFIERGAENGAPKYMEWYSAFGLIVTLVWLYLEMLRLLSKSRK